MGLLSVTPMLSRTFPAVLLAVGVLAAGCSSEEDGAEPDARAGEIRGNDVWKNGVVLTGTVTIAKDAVVEIEPGAQIKCAEGGAISVAGTLRVRAAANHAKISCARWSGIAVTAGGKLDVEGLDLDNALLAVGLDDGAAPSRYADGTVVSSLRPIYVGKGAKLEVARAKMSVPDKVADTEVSISEVHGTLAASRLEYDAKANEGISVKKGGELTVEDSVIKGKNGLDLISSYGGKSVKVSYTTLDGAHCGVHIDADAASKTPTTSFEIDHVTSDPNTFAITIYASGAGPNTVQQSNMVGLAAWIDFQGDHGPITFDGVYTSGGEVMTGGPAPTIKNKATAPVSGAKPR